jgi:hypothetical protein
MICVALAVAIATGCGQPAGVSVGVDEPAPRASARRRFRVPAQVPLQIEKVVYEYDPPGSLMGDGITVLIAQITEDSLDSFIKEHASVELEWTDGPFHIGDIGMAGPELVKWFHDWHTAAEIRDEIAAVVDWQHTLTHSDSKRFYRVWYKHHRSEVGGKDRWQIDNARLWIIDVESRLLIYLLVNT